MAGVKQLFVSRSMTLRFVYISISWFLFTIFWLTLDYETLDLYTIVQGVHVQGE